jgi:uncharacterized protein (DUF1499 family)
MKQRARSAVELATLLAAWLLLCGCAGTAPGHLGSGQARLAPCPPTPNCVCSDATDPEHAIAPLRLAVDANEAWAAVHQQVLALPRTIVAIDDADYLHAESTSATMGYVDDLELQLRPDEAIIAVRSASRLGRSDFGVNRKRVETLRSALVARGIVR